jgi:hypothetical protein
MPCAPLRGRIVGRRQRDGQKTVAGWFDALLVDRQLLGLLLKFDAPTHRWVGHLSPCRPQLSTESTLHWTSWTRIAALLLPHDRFYAKLRWEKTGWA